MLALEVLDACQITYIKTADKGAQSHRPPESLLGRVYPHMAEPYACAESRPRRVSEPALPRMPAGHTCCVGVENR